MNPGVEQQSGTPDYHGVKVLAVVVGSLCIFAVALTLGMGHLYMMAVTTAAVPLVSYVIGRRMLTNLSVRREVQDVVWDDQPVRVKLLVENRSRLPKYFLQARDTLPQGARFVEGDGVIPLAVPPGGNQVAEYEVIFQYRGRYRLGPLDVQATDPLGMFFFMVRLREQTEVLVLPSPLPLESAESLGGALYSMAGVHSVPVRGDSAEFLGIREYVPGDPLRRVDWKHSARYGELFVREFERYTRTEVCVLLDCSPVMRQVPGAFEMMVKAASGALHRAYWGGLPFRLLIGVPEVDERAAEWSADHLYSYLYALAEVTPRSDFDWMELVRKAVAEVPTGTQLVLITANVEMRLLPLLDACVRRQIQTMLLLPNVPAVDKASGFHDALHDGEFLRAVSALNATVVPLHPGGGS